MFTISSKIYRGKIGDGGGGANFQLTKADGAMSIKQNTADKDCGILFF